MKRKSIIVFICISTLLLSGCSFMLNNSKQENAAKTESPYLQDGLYKKFYRPKYYEKYFEDEFSEYRIDDISLWKDADGSWCYPENYELNCIPGHDDVMATQQFPEELLSSMDTAELYEFVLNAPGEMLIMAYDDYLAALSTYRSIYNFMDNLMEREDFPSVVHDHYKSYSKEEVKLMTKENHAASPEPDFKTLDQFQLTEALERFYTGKLVPQKVD